MLSKLWKKLFPFGAVKKAEPTHTHVMLDLETLGKRPGCKILSIGAVVFGPSGLGDTFYIEVQREYQGALVEDPDTIAWWSSQSAEARDRLFNSEGKPTLKIALKGFNTWLRAKSGTDSKGRQLLCVWGNGADFDNAIIQTAFDAVTTEPPAWDFWNNRCYRTLKGLLPDVKLERQGVHHNAQDDAVSQAEHAVRLLKELGVWAGK